MSSDVSKAYVPLEPRSSSTELKMKYLGETEIGEIVLPYLDLYTAHSF